MTLFRQLVLAVLALTLLLYGVNSAISLSNTRGLVAQQMAVHAQDAATSMALALSQGDIAADPTLQEVLFNAISDGGYYQRIQFREPNGEIRLAREFPAGELRVPGWFVALMALPEYTGRAEVSNGWNRLGEILVVSNPGQTYRQLWRLAWEQLLWFTVAAILFSGLGILGLRWLLRPLGHIEAQADAIREQRFVVQEVLPRARELRSVVDAMNRMAQGLRQLFASQAGMIADLRRAAAVDPVTGLANRADFDARMNALVADDMEARRGMLAIIALDELARINDLAGRTEGNTLLAAIGQGLRDGLAEYSGAVVARRQGAEFAVFVADLDAREADVAALHALRCAEATAFAHREELPLRFRMGYSYSSAIDRETDLLGEADQALRRVAPGAAPNYLRHGAVDAGAIPLVSRPGFDWAGLIESLLAQRSLELLYQPTVGGPGRDPIGCEVYSRMRPEAGAHAIAAGVLLPMVERVGRAPAYDRLVLELLAARTDLESPMYAVNLGIPSLRSAEFRSWLDEFLAVNRALANRLVFEVPERALAVAEGATRDFQRLVGSHGCGLALDHFGLESSNFAYLGSLPLAHVKVHRSITRDIDQQRDNQFYLKFMAELMRAREMLLLVEGIEREAEWSTCAELGVDAGQGFLLGRPEPR
ncbi:MAG: EAL domain-containing protein [Porticoccaceae bacterium]